MRYLMLSALLLVSACNNSGDLKAAINDSEARLAQRLDELEGSENQLETPETGATILNQTTPSGRVSGDLDGQYVLRDTFPRERFYSFDQISADVIESYQVVEAWIEVRAQGRVVDVKAEVAVKYVNNTSSADLINSSGQSYHEPKIITFSAADIEQAGPLLEVVKDPKTVISCGSIQIDDNGSWNREVIPFAAESESLICAGGIQEARRQ